MRFGSVCSGIEAASAAWHPLGWRAAFLSEIEAFPRAVLKHHYGDTPLHGDFTTIQAGDYDPIDLLVGGTPCQSFSVAGLRGGLDDDRGNLALEYLRLAQRLRPRWLVWENVPGVLSSAGGRDFGAILGGLAELGYGFAYRVLDAQFFGVAQRRRRVFVVGHLGDWRRAAAVLFERASLSGHPAPRRQAREGTAISPSLRARANSSHRADSQAFIPEIGYALNAHGGAHGRQDAESETLIAHTLKAEGFDASEDGTGRGIPLVCDTLTSNGDNHSGFRDEKGLIAFNITTSNSNKDYNARQSERAQAVTAGGNRPSARGGDLIAFDLAQITSAANRTRVEPGLRGREGGAMPEIGGDHIGALRSASGGSSRDYVAFGWQNSHHQGDSASSHTTPTLDKSKTPAVGWGSGVRRLTPRECERLQGFPDGYTLIPWRKGDAPDGPRYKALGNSMAVPVMRWIGERISIVDGADD